MNSTPRPSESVAIRGRIGTFVRVLDGMFIVYTREYLEVADPSNVIVSSAHARRMAKQRSEYLTNPITLWIVGQKVEEPHGMDAEEVRYDEQSEAVVLRKNNTLVTVISTKTAKTRLKKAIQ